ncbi:hypothetical protein LBMAG42_32610 [Deltaproteobacteria bacterium]|nr:hypothetical protein LBMAG42_32610 [Deltaproteobacteria bacterium]
MAFGRAGSYVGRVAAGRSNVLPRSIEGFLKVESTPGSGEFLSVSLDPKRCPCVGFRADGWCAHLGIARDLAPGGPQRSRYLFKSALHKELRRGDVSAASHWAAWVDRTFGPSTSLAYLRKIWSEETLNLDLAVRLHRDDVELGEAIALFCQSKKVWEFPQVWAAMERAWGPLPLEEAGGGTGARTLSARVRAADYDALIRQFNGSAKFGRRRAEFRSRLVAELVDAGRLSVEQQRVFELRFASGRYEAEDLVLLLLAGRLMPAEASAYGVARAEPVPRRLLDGSCVLAFPDYVYDYHTVAGRERLARWDEENPGRSLRLGVDTDPIDLRWAGGTMTLFWRFEAFRQVGSTAAMDRLRWVDVRPTARWRRFVAWNEDWP